MIDQPALEAEAAVLGAALQDPVAADRMVETLVAGDFLDQRHRIVFAAIAAIVAERGPIDLVSVGTYTVPNGVGRGFLAGLCAGVIHGGHAVHHARIVLAASITRALAVAAEDLRVECQESSPTPGSSDALIAGFLERVDALRQRLPTRAYEPAVNAEPQFLERVLNDERTPDGLPTGFYDLDRDRGILRDGEMIVLAARPSVGKSLFAQNVIEHLTLSEAPVPVLLFSMEMSASAIYRRYLFGASGVSNFDAFAGHVSEQGKESLRDAHAALNRAPWYIHDEGVMTPQRIHAMARRFQAKHGKGLIVVDYLGLVSVDRTSIYERVTEASRCMKQMAVDLKCPVLVLCQLNRRFDQAGPRKMDDDNRAMPTLSDLRDSGAIEQDADVVIFLARDTMNKTPHPCDVYVAKNRPGKTGMCQVLFDTNGPRFRNLSKQWNGEV